jgi:pimeloyl-ACP methyl ester carboxylesterase
MQAVLENAVLLGQFSGLVGIVSERAEGLPGVDDTERREQPGIIILNTGILHRVGAGRLSTILARRLAIAGYYVLRFDLSGIGDSKRRRDNLPPAEGAMADLRDAVDWFQSARGIQRVILIGICSGADLSLLYAGGDLRVVGMAIVDASTPPTCWHYLLKCFDHKAWRRKLQAILNVAKAHGASPETHNASDVFQYDHSLELNNRRARATLADAYRNAFANSVRILAIFTTGAAWYNYRNQLFDAFPDINFEGNLRFEYFKRCDHLITHEGNRSRFFEVVESWLALTNFNCSSAERARFIK